MRKIILQEYVSLDGLAADAEGKLAFIDTYTANEDNRFQEDALRFLDRVDTMILGANTYHMFVNYWPEATGEGAFGEKLNSLSKYVVSSTLDSAPWGRWEGAEIIRDSPAQALAKLKQHSGQDIVVWGSLTLAELLMKEGLLDEYQLRVCPVVLGEGKKLFVNGIGELPLKLIEAKAYEAGMVLLRYEPTK